MILSLLNIPTRIFGGSVTVSSTGPATQQPDKMVDAGKGSTEGCDNPNQQLLDHGLLEDRKRNTKPSLWSSWCCCFRREVQEDDRPIDSYEQSGKPLLS